MINKAVILILFHAIAIFFFVSNAQESSIEREDTVNSSKNATEDAFDYLYDFLIDNDNKKMCSMMKDSDLDRILKPIGEYTLLVPSDTALMLQPGSLVDELRNDPIKKQEFILSHILPGKITLNNLKPLDEISTLSANGNPVHIIAYPNGFVINGANVLDSDKSVGNASGIVHKIDDVLYPPPRQNMVDYIKSRYDQMSRFIKRAGLDEQISRNTVTFFVPTDEAFLAIPWSVTQQLLINSTFLKRVIENHIVPGTFYANGLPGNNINSIGEELLNFTEAEVQSRKYTLVNNVPIINPDEMTTNGVVHGISRIILPDDVGEEDNKCTPSETYRKSKSLELEIPTPPPPKRTNNNFNFQSAVNQDFYRRSQYDRFRTNNSSNKPRNKPNTWDGRLPLNDESASPRRPPQRQYLPPNTQPNPFNVPRQPVSPYSSVIISNPNFYYENGFFQPSTRPYTTSTPTPPTTTITEVSVSSNPGFFRRTLPSRDRTVTQPPNSVDTPPPYEYKPPRAPRRNTEVTTNSPFTVTATSSPYRSWYTTTTKPEVNPFLNGNINNNNNREDPLTPTPFFDSSRLPTTDALAGANSTDNRYAPASSRNQNRPITTPAAATTATTTGSNNDDKDEKLLASIDEIINDPGLTLKGKPISFKKFNENLKQADLKNFTKLFGPLTLFLPTDDAFRSLPLKKQSELNRNKNELRNLLLNHITNIMIPKSALKTNLIVHTYAGNSIPINVEGNGKRVLIKNTPILAATAARNGMIYVIDKVLYEEDDNNKNENNENFKPKNTNLNLMQEIKKRPELSRFAKILEKTDFPEKLQGSGPYTILVPENSAFDELPENLQNIINDAKSLNRLIGNHLLNGNFSSRLLAKTRSLPSNNGPENPLRFSLLPGAIIINNKASLMQPDIQTSNGIIHIINRFLLPEDPINKPVSSESTHLRPHESNQGPTVAKPKSFDSNLLNNVYINNNFLRNLKRSGILDDLKNKSQDLTIIVPSDNAINKLPSKITKLLQNHPDKLKSLFRYHVIGKLISFKSLNDSDVLRSIDGKPIRFNIYDNNTLYTLSGAPIKKIEINGNQLMVYVDKVLYPPQGNIVDIINRSPILKTLSKLIRFAKLDREISQPGPYTLFAPSDEAFEKFPPNELDIILRNTDLTRAFLLRHIVQPLIFTSATNSSANNATVVRNVLGEKMVLQSQPDFVSINGSTLSFADITANNGVVHVINSIL